MGGWSGGWVGGAGDAGGGGWVLPMCLWPGVVLRGLWEHHLVGLARSFISMRRLVPACRLGSVEGEASRVIDFLSGVAVAIASCAVNCLGRLRQGLCCTLGNLGCTVTSLRLYRTCCSILPVQCDGCLIAGSQPYSPKASPPSSPRHPSEGEDVWPDDLDPAQVQRRRQGVLRVLRACGVAVAPYEGAGLTACAAGSVLWDMPEQACFF